MAKLGGRHAAFLISHQSEITRGLGKTEWDILTRFHIQMWKGNQKWGCGIWGASSCPSSEPPGVEAGPRLSMARVQSLTLFILHHTTLVHSSHDFSIQDKFTNSEILATFPPYLPSCGCSEHVYICYGSSRVWNLEYVKHADGNALRGSLSRETCQRSISKNVAPGCLPQNFLPRFSWSQNSRSHSRTVEAKLQDWGALALTINRKLEPILSSLTWTWQIERMSPYF